PLWLTPDGHSLLFSTKDGVRRWDVVRRELRSDFWAGPWSLMSADGTVLVSYGLQEGTVRRHDLAGGGPPATWTARDGISAWALSPDGQRLAVALQDKGAAEVRDSTTNKTLVSLPKAETSNASRIVFSPDGKMIALVAQDEQRAWLFDASTGQPAVTL